MSISIGEMRSLTPDERIGQAAAARDMSSYDAGRKSPEQRAAAEAAVLAIRAAAARDHPGVITSPVIAWAESPAHARRVARSLRMYARCKAYHDAARGGSAAKIAAAAGMVMPPTLQPQGIAHAFYRAYGDGRHAPRSRSMPVPRAWDSLGWPWLTSEVPEALAMALAIADAAGGEVPDAPVWEAATMVWQIPEAVILFAHPVSVRVAGEADARLANMDQDRLRSAAEWRAGTVWPGVLHCTDGPAVTWPDGTEEYWWAGRSVSAWLLEHPELLAPMAAGNAEDQREAIEKFGWDVMVTAAGMSPLGPPEPDPGSPGQFIRLWEIPAHVLGHREKVLECRNGSEEPDGTRRRYMLAAGPRPRTALEAAAQLAQLTTAQYASMQRRT
jgi:hypothetical protein